MNGKAFLAILFLLFQLSFLNTFADTIISNPQDEWMADIVEFPGFYILSGGVKTGPNGTSYIIKLGKDGTIIKDTIFDYGSISFQLLKVDNEIVIF